MNKWERRDISRLVSVGNNARQKSHKKLERWIEIVRKKKERKIILAQEKEKREYKEENIKRISERKKKRKREWERERTKSYDTEISNLICRYQRYLCEPNEKKCIERNKIWWL